MQNSGGRVTMRRLHSTGASGYVFHILSPWWDSHLQPVELKPRCGLRIPILDLFQVEKEDRRKANSRGAPDMSWAKAVAEKEGEPSKE